VNPRSRVIFRLEPFSDERPFVLGQFGEHLVVEGVSFEHTGYGLTYRHERYPDVASIQNTVWHNRFRPSELSFLRCDECRHETPLPGALRREP
jgi:hypothetical protein